MAAILDFLPTMHCLKYFPTTPLCRAQLYNRNQKYESASIVLKNDINLLFDLGQLAAILDFTHNATSNVIETP